MTSLLFFDIETVPEYRFFTEAPEVVQSFFEKKAAAAGNNTSPVDLYTETVSLYPEFAKIACVTMAYRVAGELASMAPPEFKIKSYCELHEPTMLMQVASAIQSFDNATIKARNIAGLCGHNIIEFDIPFLCKRMVKHRIQLPKLLNPAGKKPWELTHVDTMQVAKYGSFKGAVSIANLCYMLGIKTPKGDMDGSMVASVYYSEDLNRFDRIAAYCEEDVRASIEVEDSLSQRYELVNEIILKR